MMTYLFEIKIRKLDLNLDGEFLNLSFLAGFNGNSLMQIYYWHMHKEIN